MSDEQQQTEKTYPQIDGSELGRFHTAKGVNSTKCWVCGNGTWFIQSDATHPFNVLEWHGPHGERTENAFQTLVLACSNCGTLWNIDYGTVIKWLKDNPV